ERYSITRPTLSGAITESAIDPPEVHHIVAEPVRRVRVILRQPLNLIVAIGQRYKLAMVNRCRRRENLNVYDRTVTAHNLRLIRGSHRPRILRPIVRLVVPVYSRDPILADNLMRPNLVGKRRHESHYRTRSASRCHQPYCNQCTGRRGRSTLSPVGNAIM